MTIVTKNTHPSPVIIQMKDYDVIEELVGILTNMKIVLQNHFFLTGIYCCHYH